MTTKNLLLSLAFAIMSFHAYSGMVTLDSGQTANATSNPFPGLMEDDTLMIQGVFYLDSSYVTYQDTALVLIINGPTARIHWNSNYELRIGAGSSMLFFNGGDLTVTGSCNNTKSIYFGNTLVAACVGGSQGVLNFADIVSSGGLDTNGNQLPVSWTDFSYRNLDAANIELRWSTASEVNNDHFIIEQSTDGISWEQIAYVYSLAQGGNSNQLLNYTYVCTIPEKHSKMYFRIKQTDFDGSFDYSPVLAITQIENNVLEISRTSEGITFRLMSEVQPNAQIRVWDCNGRLITELHPNKVGTLQLRHFGLYVLEYRNGTHLENIKLVY